MAETPTKKLITSARPENKFKCIGEKKKEEK